MNFLLVLLAIFIINIIFGYWRSNTKRFSLRWIMAVHIPVPLAIGLRLVFLGWNWITVPVFVFDFFAGQYAGGMARRSLAKRQPMPLTSNLAADLVKIIRNRKSNPRVVKTGKKYIIP